MASSDDRKEQRLLVLGGNGLLGSEFVLDAVASLSDSGAVRLVLVSRGRHYFDNEQRLASAAAASRVTVERVTLNRKYEQLASGSQAAAIEQLRGHGPFDCVVDFTSTRPESLAYLLQALAGCYRYWLYVSSDSVYEVCFASLASVDDTERDVDTAPPPLCEEDAVRPAAFDVRAALAARDSYAEAKLACEEVLQYFRVPYVALRLPDVLGARDSTRRLLLYAVWADYVGQRLAVDCSRADALPVAAQHAAMASPQLAERAGRGVHLPAACNKRLSFVGARDVATCLTALVRRLAVEQAACPALNQAFNLACAEQPTLRQFVTLIAAALGYDAAQFDRCAFVVEQPAHTFFPSVTRGPVAIDKARRTLSFQPSPLADVVAQSVDFIRQSMLPSSTVPSPVHLSELHDALCSFVDTFVDSSSSEEDSV